MIARIASFTGSSARRLSSWIKARLVTTNKTTRKSVCRVFSVVNGDPREAGAVPMSTGGTPQDGRDSQRYHAAYQLPDCERRSVAALSRAANLRAARQSPFVEMQGFGDAAGAA